MTRTTTTWPAFIVDSPSRLAPGSMLPVWLDQTVEVSGRRHPGPHPAGKAEVMADGRLAVRLIEATVAGRTAYGLLEIDALGLTVEGVPPVVWLRA